MAETGLVVIKENFMTLSQVDRSKKTKIRIEGC